jgi:hypothetical protein
MIFLLILFCKNHRKFYLIYLDSAHEQGETLIELALYWNILQPGGVLFGDD